jgi:hypothetical protein
MQEIESDQLYSYQVRDRLRFLSAEALSCLKALSAIRLAGRGATAGSGQGSSADALVSDNLVTALFVVAVMGLIFVLTRMSRRNGLGRPYVRYLNSFM